MSQFNWTVVDDFGGKFHVGMYHGDASGHLMVHCNWKIIIIDFEVLDSKQYSFYLGHEFCHLYVEKEQKNFSYALKTDNSAKTPLNEKRQKALRKDSFKSIAVFICLFFVLVVALYFFKTIY